MVRAVGSAAITSVWSRLPDRLTSRPPAVSRIGSRGVPSPIDTSGQYGTQSTYGPSSSVRNRNRLWPPSNRTGDPSKHEDTPSRGRSIIDIQHGVFSWFALCKGPLWLLAA